jgi:two-component system chemotaxis response regulator CheY
MHALIVEDDLVCRKVLHKLLAGYGTVESVNCGSDALIAVTQAREAGKPFQLVCLDIDMPDMTGHQVLVQLRREEDERSTPADQRLRVLMTSGHSQPENVIASFHNRCDGFLVKPVNPHRLAERLNAFGFAPLSEGDYEPGQTDAPVPGPPR